MPRTRLYDKYKAKMQKIADLGHATAVLSWDKETYLPSKGAAFRSQQLATLSGVIHDEFTNREFGVMLKRLSGQKGLNAIERKNVNVTLKNYNKEKLFSREFVMKKSMTISEVFHAWIQAKKEDNFDLFAEPFNRLLAIKREEARIINKGDHPYDALIDIYEPNMTVAKLDVIFSEVKEKLLPLIQSIRGSIKVKDKFLRKHYDKDTQWTYGLHLLKEMGYDFEAGRQDIAAHPFTISFAPTDVRVTTRIDENDLANMTWSCIHEGGHALYEQGLPELEYGLPSGSAISLAIHESQSRLWENNVGRSLNYWKHHYPKLQETFPSNLKNVTLEDFYKAINKIKPNLIRTEADELHYHLHVMLRYEIEKEIMGSDIDAYGVRDLWNEKTEAYFGIKVDKDSNGVLQDVHWSHGSIGYFPTYSLGSFYAAQFYQQAEKDIPKLKKSIKNGDTQPLLAWLRDKIHQYGRKYEAEEICEMITGEPLNYKYFDAYVKKKYRKMAKL